MHDRGHQDYNHQCSQNTHRVFDLMTIPLRAALECVLIYYLPRMSKYGPQMKERKRIK
jgi:hypothetical protein